MGLALLEASPDLESWAGLHVLDTEKRVVGRA